MEQMKLLLTADIHFRIDWFRWLIGQAPNYDLVCIVGDLLDIFEVKSTREQAREVTSLLRELADIVPVAVCSGNHDNAGRLVSHDRSSLYEWFIDLGAHSKIITDGFNAKAREVDCNDNSVSLLEGTKINLARSRLFDSQTNRETLDRSSSRSA